MKLAEVTNVTAKRQKSGRWTTAQADLFEELVQQYGKNWKKIQGVIKSRTLSQIRSHGQKFFDRVGPEKAQEYERKAKLLEAIEVLKIQKIWQGHEKEKNKAIKPVAAVKRESDPTRQKDEAVEELELKNPSTEPVACLIKEQFKENLDGQPQAPIQNFLQNSPQLSNGASLQEQSTIFTPIFWYPAGYACSTVGAQTLKYYQGDYSKANN